MDAPHAVVQLQPDPATIHAELRERCPGVVDEGWQPIVVPADGMHARCQHEVGQIAVGKSKSQGIHARAI
jgi:hypothetical protein